MFWADKVAQELKKRKLPLEWVDDMKTPSGKVHMGALRGVVIHDLVYKALKDAGVKTKYTYVFDDHDPMDSLPVYLPKEKYGKYLGMPLYKIPSPVEGFKSYAEYYAQDFIKTFNAIGSNPEILWSTDLYGSGRMNGVIKECLDKTEVVRGIYEELYKKPLPKDWYPFQVYCPNCGKVSTTKVTHWDGKEVAFCCEIDRLDWTKGCGICAKVSPFSSDEKIAGKLPWKVEWAAKWKVIGVTVEGAGKDHMSKGGSHDLASLVCKRVLDYPVPYPIAYEFFLVRGKKMASSRGIGLSASEMIEILPPEILRFLMVKTKLNQAINFDPSGDTIPKLFDEYQAAALEHKSGAKTDIARVFELSQIGKLKYPPTVRFAHLTQWIQMPDMQGEIKKYGLQEWVPYAKVWLEKYAPEDKKFEIQKVLPESTKTLSENQRKFLRELSKQLDQDWKAEDFQTKIYELGKELGLTSQEIFESIYKVLIGKSHGPKAAWLILSQTKQFIKKRFGEAIHYNDIYHYSEKSSSKKARRLDKPEIFSIDQEVQKRFPTVSIGVAIIKGVSIIMSDEDLEEEKKQLLQSFSDLTTEQVSDYVEIISYRKLYKETGIDWHSRRPSPEALLRRIALKKGLYDINTCVDAYNLIVMKQRVSIGAFDLDKINFPTVLRFAKEGEGILLLGDDQPTKYKNGEIAYFDKEGGYNIDFNYRDAQRTAVQLSTKNIYVNVDGVYEITPSKVEQVLKEAANKIMQYCGGKLELLGIETAS